MKKVTIAIYYPENSAWYMASAPQYNLKSRYVPTLDFATAELEIKLMDLKSKEVDHNFEYKALSKASKEKYFQHFMDLEIE